MYNSVTELKIKEIPQIGELDINNLPRELTRIYAQIITYRRQIAKGELNFSYSEFLNSIKFLQSISNNLETLLIKIPNYEKKESIAFVAGTTYSLIYAINENQNDIPLNDLLAENYISPLISSVLLFLIGNSQADAAEMANKIQISESLNNCKKKLVNYIKALAKGRLLDIINDPYTQEDIDNSTIETTALDLLWRELGMGIELIANKLTGNKSSHNKDNLHFDKVIQLSVDDSILKQKSIFSGPYHLSKLLKSIENELTERGVINIETPLNVNADKWGLFLSNLSIQRPYLWENHSDAVSTSFLNPGTSAVLTLPTGAGKSTLSELKIASCIFSEKNVLYLVPTHALEDQVNKNLRSIFKDIKTNNIEFDSEYSELINNHSYPILVMTPERCLTAINMDSTFLDNIGLVVFDEFHLIHGINLIRDRRSLDAMYCLISLFTYIPNSDFLLISAMVQNGEEISEWVSSITNKECLLFNSSWKPTRQLLGCLVYQNKEITSLRNKLVTSKNIGKTKNVPIKLKRQLHAKPYCLFSLKKIWESVDESDYYTGNILDENVLLGSNKYWGLTSNRNKVAAELTKHFTNLGLKTLVFVSNPVVAMSTAKEINLELSNRSNYFDSFQEIHKDEMNSLILELGSFNSSYFDNGENVGVHHGLLLPLERHLIEEYFKKKEGSIALVATATLAQGINLPAEIVIIAGDDRFNEELNTMEAVSPHELLNAAGRAGRAGQSSQGAVIIIPGKITTIEDSKLSSSWWKLKDEVFSKSDQCLNIEDPLEYFLDSIQEDSLPLNINQTNVLFRFKSEEISEKDTKKLLQNSFYAFKSLKNEKQELFKNQVNGLLKRRSELNQLSKNIGWTKEISYKTGIDPDLILELGNSIDSLELLEFSNKSISSIVDWYLEWIKDDPNRLTKIFTKKSTLSQLNKVTGNKSDNDKIGLILSNFSILKKVLLLFIKGATLTELNSIISTSIKSKKEDKYLELSRNFSIRLIPEISFAFGLLTMVILEKAKQQKINKVSLPMSIKTLASCIREGVDNYSKLDYKIRNDIMSRVETHIKYNAN